LICAIPALAQAQEPGDSVRIEAQVVRILREAHAGGAIQVAPTARALLERYAICQGDSLRKVCRLPGREPVYIIAPVRIRGDTASVRVTTFRDSPSFGISSVSHTWLFSRSGAKWKKIGIRESETLIVN
jgi:hypothetical protein